MSKLGLGRKRVFTTPPSSPSNLTQLPFEFSNDVMIPEQSMTSLVILEIIYRLSQCMWSESINVTDGQTDYMMRLEYRALRTVKKGKSLYLL